MSNESLHKALRDGRFEETEHGLLVPSERSLVQGIVVYGKRGEPEERTHNLIVGEGLTYLVAVATGETPVQSSWYVAIFSGDVTVQATWTAANFAANATEFTQYVNGARPAWVPGSTSGGARDSFASKAEFESSVDGAVIRGAALVSSSTKSGTGGVLMGATRFTNDKPLDTGELLDVGYGLQVTAVT